MADGTYKTCSIRAPCPVNATEIYRAPTNKYCDNKASLPTLNCNTNYVNCDTVCATTGRSVVSCTSASACPANAQVFYIPNYPRISCNSYSYSAYADTCASQIAKLNSN